MIPTLRDRFRGCLIGQAVGDAIGARFEAQSAEFLRQRFSNFDELMNALDGELWYTDDTQMAIGVAETLIICKAIDEAQLCRAFVANYVPSRGYGRGTRAVLEAIEDGRDYRAVAERYFPGGSKGNGAAMRVAPVGLLFHHSTALLREHAKRSAVPTHVHPLAIEGATIFAAAIGLCASRAPSPHRGMLSELVSQAISPEFRSKLQLAETIKSPATLAALGNGIEATESVVTAIAGFVLSPGSFLETIGNVILLGGDTDTLAAMAGALSGTHLGLEGIPKQLTDSLERSPKGRSYLLQLADELYEAHCAISVSQ